MSHSDQEAHLEVIRHLTRINEEYHFHVGILADLQGPKLRIGKIKDQTLDLQTGDEVIFTNTPCEGTAEGIYMSYELFPKEVAAGDKVLVDDGKLIFEVVDTDRKNSVRLKVLFGGVLSSNKGVNLPDTLISLPSLTDKDLKDLDFLIGQPVHWIALSFVRKADDIHDLRERLQKAGHQARIVAKIEKPEALKNINEVISATDAVMVARGDLGVEVPIEKLPGIQKEIVRRCIEHSRPVIVATQMMESMIQNPSPTRAEVTHAECGNLRRQTSHPRSGGHVENHSRNGKALPAQPKPFAQTVQRLGNLPGGCALLQCRENLGRSRCQSHHRHDHLRLYRF
jgi:pyruvate kinase